MSVPDVKTVLNEASVTFCVDTDLLVEFKPIQTIPWREIAPNATKIRIIIPTKVGEEMDAHKKNAGRLRRRALEFAKLARVIDESSDEVAEIRASNPRVTVEFGPIFHKRDLDGDLYELDDSDGRVVAEVAKIVETCPQAIFLSNDGKPLRLAKQTGLLRQRPIESWRREEGSDERDREIEDLRHALGAQPSLVVGFPNASNDRREHIIEPPPDAICSMCVEGLVKAALSIDPQLSRDVLVKKYGIASSDPFVGPFRSGLTRSDLDEYEADYRSFIERVRTWANSLPRLLRSQGTLQPIVIEVGNDGNRAADRVHVQAELCGAFHFAPLHLFDALLEKFLEPPEPSDPMSRLGSSSIIQAATLLKPSFENRRPDDFYPQDEPADHEKTTCVSWRCEELRQGISRALPVLVAADKPGTRGALKIRASGALISKPVDIIAPLIAASSPRSERFCTYLLRHIELLPQKYQGPCDNVLQELMAKCTCDTG